MTRRVALIAIASCTLALIGGLWLLADETRGQRSSDVAEHRNLEPSATASANLGATVAAEIAKLSKPTDVDAYLSSLIRTVEERGRVQPDDYTAGRLAIQRLRGVMPEDEMQARARAWGEKLSLLDRTLRDKPVMDTLDELAKQLANAPDKQAKRALADQYRSATRDLPSHTRQVALDRLAVLLARS